MATKDISDEQVVRAYIEAREADNRAEGLFPYDILERETGECQKVCYRAMERAHRRGYIDYGVSLRTGWVTEAGMALLQRVASDDALGDYTVAAEHIAQDIEQHIVETVSAATE